MNQDTRTSLSAKLTAASALIAELHDSLVRGLEPRALLHDADALQDRAAEVLALVVEACRAPSEMAFVGGNVEIGPERTAEEDRASQYVTQRRSA